MVSTAYSMIQKNVFKARSVRSKITDFYLHTSSIQEIENRAIAIAIDIIFLLYTFMQKTTIKV